ncbi:MAG: hypothetical protein JNK75_04285 [Betaproteobacteria bacterium]|nr:hypothetical protein [Betaproteobacteria bacterium]
MPHAKKVILVLESGSVLNRDHLLNELFEDRIELFCAVGKDAAEWEDLMDWVCVEAEVEKGIDHLVLTTSHETGSLDDVVELAHQISVPSGEQEVEIIRV